MIGDEEEAERADSAQDRQERHADRKGPGGQRQQRRPRRLARDDRDLLAGQLARRLRLVTVDAGLMPQQVQIGGDDQEAGRKQTEQKRPGDVLGRKPIDQPDDRAEEHRGDEDAGGDLHDGSCALCG